jgi:hypothetical protein
LVAVQYHQGFPNTPDNKAAANKRTGHRISGYKSKKDIPSPTIMPMPPIAIPTKPQSLCIQPATIKMTAVIINSSSSRAKANTSSAANIMIYRGKV